MVKIMEHPIKMDDLGGRPTIFGNIHIDDIDYSIVFKATLPPCQVFFFGGWE